MASKLSGILLLFIIQYNPSMFRVFALIRQGVESLGFITSYNIRKEIWLQIAHFFTQSRTLTSSKQQLLSDINHVNIQVRETSNSDNFILNQYPTKWPIFC